MTTTTKNQISKVESIELINFAGIKHKKINFNNFNVFYSKNSIGKNVFLNTLKQLKQSIKTYDNQTDYIINMSKENYEALLTDNKPTIVSDIFEHSIPKIVNRDNHGYHQQTAESTLIYNFIINNHYYSYVLKLGLSNKNEFTINDEKLLFSKKSTDNKDTIFRCVQEHDENSIHYNIKINDKYITSKTIIKKCIEAKQGVFDTHTLLSILPNVFNYMRDEFISKHVKSCIQDIYDFINKFTFINDYRKEDVVNNIAYGKTSQQNEEYLNKVSNSLNKYLQKFISTVYDVHYDNTYLSNSNFMKYNLYIIYNRNNQLEKVYYNQLSSQEKLLIQLFKPLIMNKDTSLFIVNNVDRLNNYFLNTLYYEYFESDDREIMLSLHDDENIIFPLHEI